MKRLAMSLTGAALLAAVAACGREPANDQAPAAAEPPAANDAALLNDAAPDPAAAPAPPAPPEPAAGPKAKEPESEPKVIIDPPPPDPHVDHEMNER